MALSATSNDHSQTENGAQVSMRQLAEFHPSLWGNRFADYVPDDKVLSDMKVRRDELKEKVKEELISTATNPSKQLKLIGDVQRLGIGYHFEKEIDGALTLVYEAHHDYELNNHDDLYDVSLRFRLLRQQGFNISCEIFNKFKNEQGNFIEKLAEDKQGLLGLYEAAHMRKHGEEILDKALVFATTHLRDAIETSSVHLASQVKHALVYPIRKNIPRLEARYYLSVYDQVESYSKVVSDFAKLDFNFLQTFHKQELKDVTRWWNELDFATKLPYARNRIVEIFFWILGIVREPKLSYARMIATKALVIVSYLNDTYDTYGTLEDLTLFSSAIKRWNVDCLHELPEYMKILYQAILDHYGEIEKHMIKKGRPYCAHYAKESMKRQVNAYFAEAKWFFNNEVPTLEQYMSTAIMSAGHHFLSLTTLVGDEELATEKNVEKMFNIPKALRASGAIGRLLNDVVSHKFEQKRGHAPSAVECYMIDHGVTEEEAIEELRKELANAWKDINDAMLMPFDQDMPLPSLKIVLYVTAVSEVIYTEGDGYTHVGKDMQTHITSLLVDPVPI